MSIADSRFAWMSGGVRSSALPLDHPEILARTRRILLVILALVLMSAADLFCTIAYLTSIGMVEANPIARHMLSVGGLRQLIMYKAFTITLSCGCIYLARRSRGAEVCAWICAAVLFALMLHWVNYNDVVTALSADLSTITTEDTGKFDDWVLITD